MSRIFARFSAAIALSLLLTASASATPTCLPDKQPFELTGDTVHWTMTIAPGADCIQGLRWSYMQIYNVSVMTPPKNGKIVMVGPGFRYFANPGFKGSDTFALSVLGKNKRNPGNSTVQIEVKPGSSGVQLLSSN
ncbi:hypothetical protein [Bradyrhizobium canariense]|uniref:Secreted protein n=1 Tax=Bradyrhizobium canariense TaxID=255045 RepID=A0A1H2BTP6_9BRAD|nr:hypothetical protein [Bradyrhizobium canariense]SDR79585.1 hypothetical protein SAMN05444158_0018 [Bradyrhizobium canariense]SDT61720.1 hypothetical protein SAMN05444158_7545 [Bradyrhizobium canariense]